MPDQKSRPVLVSACLLGRRCRYDGRDNADALLERELEAEHLRAVPFCPEEHGGLGTPRPSAWIADEGAAAVVDGDARMVDVDGRDVTDAFLAGAEGARVVCEREGIELALLKERSPSCGVHSTHVNNVLVAGNGVTTEVLRRAGIEVRGVAGRRTLPDEPESSALHGERQADCAPEP